MTAQTTHIITILTNQPGMSNVRIARLSGVSQYAVAKRRQEMGLSPLVMRTRGKAT